MFEGSNYINGRFSPIHHGGNILGTNPATGKCYGHFPDTEKATVAETVQYAKVAFSNWRRESRVHRAEFFDTLAQLIKRDHDKLRDAISTETGKSLNESHAEVNEALHMCQYVAASGRLPFGECVASELSSKDAYIVRKPRGVVGVISPWNFPLAIGSFWCAAPALIEGNTVVHKPSELTPMVNELAAQLYHEAGFPPGVYNLVHGGSETGAALVRSDLNVVLFTGSAEVGQDIRKHCAETHSKTCSIECGSKSAVMVFEDGNMDLAIDATVASAFKLSGQRCVSSGRILVERPVLEEFKDRFVERVRQITMGDPFDTPAPFCGPLISDEHRQNVCRYNVMVFNAPEAKVLYSGSSHDLPSEGFFLPPLVYQCEWADLLFLKQEVFGPHVAIIPVDDLDDAISVYNDTEYGLALGVISDDYRKHREIAQRCTTGMLYINGGSIAAESHLPFSSWKKSGYGASAAATYKAVTHTMAITVNYESGKVSWAQGMK